MEAEWGELIGVERMAELRATLELLRTKLTAPERD
jgi:hypothetical protein